MKTLRYLLLPILTSTAMAQVTPRPADSVAASMCVVVHNEIFPNHNSGTPPFYPYNYASAGFGANEQFFDVTLPAVKAAGVRCLRVGAAAPPGDGGTHQSEFQKRMQVENMEFSLDIVTGYDQANIEKNFALDGDTGGANETWEGANEPDKNERCSTIIANQKLLHDAVKTDANSLISSMPVLGPSLTTLGDVGGSTDNWLKNCPTFSGIADVGNWHTYIHTVNPEAGMPTATKQGGWDWIYFKNAKTLFPNMPIDVTEYGYAEIQPGGVGDVIHLPRSVIVRYVPRWALLKLLIGYRRSAWHQVADGYTSPQGPNAGYGLFFDSFGVAKPQGVAFGNLIHMFEDQGGQPTLTPLSYTVTRKSGNTAVPFTMLFQRSDGKYMLAFWLGEPGWDGTTKTLIKVPSELVSIQLGTSAKGVEIDTFADNGTVSKMQIPLVNGLFNINVTDHMRVAIF
jgi:hypothetical protein